MLSLADRYKPDELRQIITLLHDQLDLIRNPKSRFSVASGMVARIADGSIRMFRNGNNEISPRAHTNICGERNNLREARNHGHEHAVRKGQNPLPLIVLDNFILGYDTKQPPRQQLGRKTPCCHHCLEEIYQFKSPSDEMPTLFHQIPYFPLSMEGAMERTLAGITTDTIFDLIPPVLDIDTDDAERFLISKRAQGIFHTRTKGELFDLVAQEYKKLTGNVLDHNNIPPLNGEVTQIVRAAKIDVGDINTVEHSSKMNSLLGIMRNIAAWKHFDTNQGRVDPDIHHLDVAICGTTDGKFYIGSSLAGKNISAQYNGIFMSLNTAKNEDHNHLVSHLFIMGDPITAQHNRLYPVIGEIYDIKKRSTKSILGSAGEKEPDMRIFVFAPSAPGKQIKPDYRERSERLTAEADSNTVVRYRLSELVKSGSTFTTPAEQRRER